MKFKEFLRTFKVCANLIINCLNFLKNITLEHILHTHSTLVIKILRQKNTYSTKRMNSSIITKVKIVRKNNAEGEVLCISNLGKKIVIYKRIFMLCKNSHFSKSLKKHILAKEKDSLVKKDF